jgi:ribosomal protein S18 acetylase RimI-like enzyme
MKIREVSDRASIEREIGSDPIRALYHLGDLDKYYFSKCEWYFIYDTDLPVTVVLLYKSWGVAVLPLGDSSGLRFFLERRADLLPDRFYGTWMVEHDSVMGRSLEIPDKRPMYRMAATQESFRPSPPDNRVVDLNPSHVDAVRVLLRSYPGNFFEEYQLETGYYRGIFDAGKLVSMAGIHTTNRKNGTAAIGNIVTDEAYRGRGFARSVTSKLVDDLLLDHTLVGLNVGRENAPAIRVYERLGFDVRVKFYEGFCLKRKSSKS